MREKFWTHDRLHAYESLDTLFDGLEKLSKIEGARLRLENGHLILSTDVDLATVNCYHLFDPPTPEPQEPKEEATNVNP